MRRPDLAFTVAVVVVVSDSAALKAGAAAKWPHRVLTTAIQPAHILCQPHTPLPTDSGRASSTLHATAPDSVPTDKPTDKAHDGQSILQTVAELLLLAESDVLVIGRSRFAYAALLLSRTCQQTFHVTIDRRRRWRRCHSTPNGTWAMRCIGPDRQYSVRMLQDDDGALISLAGKPYRETRKLPLFLRNF
jgi:hypothetical protein